MYYTVLDKDLNKVFAGSYVQVHKWLKTKTFGEVYYVFNHQREEFTTGHEFFDNRIE